MRRMFVSLLLFIAVLGTTTLARADGPELTPLTGPALPMPAPLGPHTVVGMGFYRPNRLDVWQNLAVDRAGFWRPRVALFGYGAYYPNGVPYQMLPVRQMDMIPYLLD